MTTTIDSIMSDFEFLDDWEDRYRYVIDLGKELPPYPDDARDAAHKVRGCVSQVWLKTLPRRIGNDPVIEFLGDLDARISCAASSPSCWRFYSAARASEIWLTEPEEVLEKAWARRASHATTLQWPCAPWWRAASTAKPSWRKNQP
ncbi:SufE family protein [Brucella abortus]|nr:SufE family protein [Brucella abortus]